MKSAIRREILLALRASRTKRRHLSNAVFRAVTLEPELMRALDAIHLSECEHEARILKLLLRHAEPPTPHQEPHS
jgi:hypothetical protein